MRKIGCLLILIFAVTAAYSQTVVPDSIRNELRNIPENVLCGIGAAKTESDGEAILLAEDRAREAIAIQINSIYEHKSGLILIENSTSHAFINGSIVVKRAKGQDGTWWCIVTYPKEYIFIPVKDDIFDIILLNASESFDVSNMVHTDTVIPDWVLTPDSAENTVYGLGAAKLNNDEASIQLARERARRSLARSINMEISSTGYDFQADNAEPYFEICSTYTSKYDHTPIQTQLARMEKTKDGTYWVLLACPVKYTTILSQSGRRVNNRIPQSIRAAMDNVPKDALIGIGTARMASLNHSRTISAVRARAELSRQLDTIIRDMVRDYTAGSEVDHSAVLSFQENITVALSQARFQGTAVVEEDEDARGNWWTAVMLSKTGAVNEINQAVAAAKLHVPAMASFDAESRMNAAFDKVYGNEVGYSDWDY